jgi:uncharacterized protein (DUF2164 family)
MAPASAGLFVTADRNRFGEMWTAVRACDPDESGEFMGACQLKYESVGLETPDSLRDITLQSRAIVACNDWNRSTTPERPENHWQPVTDSALEDFGATLDNTCSGNRDNWVPLEGGQRRGFDAPDCGPVDYAFASPIFGVSAEVRENTQVFRLTLVPSPSSPIVLVFTMARRVVYPLSTSSTTCRDSKVGQPKTAYLEHARRSRFMTRSNGVYRRTNENQSTMKDIELTSDQLATVVPHLQRYFDDEIGQELGRFEAEFLLAFIAKHVGAEFYNAGVRDAEERLRGQMENVMESISLLEKPTR